LLRTFKGKDIERYRTVWDWTGWWLCHKELVE